MISEPNSTMDDRELANLSELIEDFDEETARELALAFLEDTANALEKLDVALSAQDAEAVRSCAHMVKGCSRVINAHPLEKRASALEDCARSNNWEGIQSEVEGFKAVYDSTRNLIVDYTSE